MPSNDNQLPYFLDFSCQLSADSPRNPIFDWVHTALPEGPEYHSTQQQYIVTFHGLDLLLRRPAEWKSNLATDSPEYEFLSNLRKLDAGIQKSKVEMGSILLTPYFRREFSERG